MSSNVLLGDIYFKGHRQRTPIMEAAVMAFVFFPDPHLHPDRAAYGFLMQVGMAIGLSPRTRSTGRPGRIDTAPQRKG